MNQVDDMEDLGIETFEDVYQRKFNPQAKQPEMEEEVVEDEGIISKAYRKGKQALTSAADYGAFGPLAMGEDMRRNTARTAARVGETLVGLPGDLREFSKFAGEWLGDKARSAIGKEPLTEEQKEQIREEIKPKTWDLVGRLTEALPTSENLREGVTRKYTGEYLEPQSEWERFSDNVFQDFAALAIPVKGKIPFARALGQSLIANAGGEVAREFGGEKAEAYTKLGLLFSMGLLSGGRKGGVKKYINGLYGEMEAAIPQGAEVATTNLSKKLDTIEAVLKKGDPGATSKQGALKKIDAIRNKIKNGTVEVEELVQFNKDINESIFELGELKRGENQLYKIREAVHDTLGEYGTNNPDFLNKWKTANEAYAATETSRRVGNWVRKNVGAKEYIYAGSALGLEGSLAGLPATLGTVGAAGALGATAYTAEIMKRIAKSPALRKYYTNVVTNSLNQNKGGLLRAMKQLDDGLKKSFEEEPFETVSFEEEEEL